MSMTAFAAAEAVFADAVYGVEMRSVNHRFLEVAVKLPENLRALEGAVRAKCQQAFYRGKVDVWIVQRGGARERSVTLNPPVMKRWLLAFSDSGVMQSLGKPDWRTMLNLPGVLVENAVDEEGLHAAVLEALDSATAQLLAMREREGGQIKRVLLQQLRDMEDKVRTAQMLQTESAAQMRENLRAKLAEYAVDFSAAADSSRLEQEIVLLINKSDVREELDRLHFHIAEARATLDEEHAVGRKMDFLMQEFNREANTFSAKAGDNALSRLAVEMKVVIEQMREQVQNLE